MGFAAPRRRTAGPLRAHKDRRVAGGQGEKQNHNTHDLKERPHPFPSRFFPLDTAGELKVEKYCNLLNGVVKFFSSFWDENYVFYREKKEVGFVR